MSNAVTALCRPLRLPATQKAVLMCLADYCHEDGKDWHSLAAVCAWTCLARSTVIEALKALEVGGLLRMVKASGKNSTTFLQLAAIQALAEAQTEQNTGPHPSGNRTGPGAEPVREPDARPSDNRTPLVREPDHPRPAAGPEASISITQASGKQQRRGTHARTPDQVREKLLPEVELQLIVDWMQVRKDKGAKTMTEAVVAKLRREASKAGLSVQEAVAMCAENSWQNIDSTWDSVKRMTGRAEGVARRGAGSRQPFDFVDVDYREGGIPDAQGT